MTGSNCSTIFSLIFGGQVVANWHEFRRSVKHTWSVLQKNTSRIIRSVTSNQFLVREIHRIRCFTKEQLALYAHQVLILPNMIETVGDRTEGLQPPASSSTFWIRTIRINYFLWTLNRCQSLLPMNSTKIKRPTDRHNVIIYFNHFLYVCSVHLLTTSHG